MRKIKADKMRERRKYLDLTQTELANMLGVSRVYLSQIERGKMVPGKALIAKIEDALHLKSGSLLIKPKIKNKIPVGKSIDK